MAEGTVADIEMMTTHPAGRDITTTTGTTIRDRGEDIKFFLLFFAPLPLVQS